MTRNVGVVSRGIRSPIIRPGDDLVKIVADSLEAAVKSDNIEDIKKKTEILSQAVYAATAKINEKASQETQQQGNPAEGAHETKDDVVDADYEVVDDNNAEKM